MNFPGGADPILVFRQLKSIAICHDRCRYATARLNYHRQSTGVVAISKWCSHQQGNNRQQQSVSRCDVNVRTVGAQFSKIYLTVKWYFCLENIYFWIWVFLVLIVYFISSCYKEWSRCWSWQENSQDQWAFLINCLWLLESELFHMGMGHQWLITPHMNLNLQSFWL